MKGMYEQPKEATRVFEKTSMPYAVTQRERERRGKKKTSTSRQCLNEMVGGGGGRGGG